MHPDPKSFGFEISELDSSLAEIGFEIPREIFSNDLDGLINELRTVKFVSDTASLLVSGQRSKIELSQLSTSDPLVTFLMSKITIAMLGGFVTWALHTWKQVEEIRALRRAASENPVLSDVEELLTKKIDVLIETSIKEKTSEIMENVDKKTEKQVAEMTKRSLRMILERVERGFAVHIRLPDYTSEEGDDESSEAEPMMAELYELRDALVFPAVTGNPVLQLSKPDEGEEKLDK